VTQGTAAAEALRRDVLGRIFAPGSARAMRMGMEVELIPVEPSTGRLVAPHEPEGGGTLPLLRGAARSRGWGEGVSYAGSPRFDLPDGSHVTYEPGGQIEISSAPAADVDALVASLEHSVGAVLEALDGGGLAVCTRGIDPLGREADARLVLDTPRYRTMDRHFGALGPWGRRMMRQTAALHVNLDPGPRPLERWRAATRAAPALVALFANSPRYEGRETGHRSFRAAQWRRLDPSRTGLGRAEEGPDGYLEFALTALEIVEGPEAPRPFRARVEAGCADEAAWRRHLSTLFPEVRPRGYLEVRCLDALPPHWYVVPATLLAGLLYDDDACREAAETLPPCDDDLLETAGREGLAAPAVRRTADAVVTLALDGARRLEGSCVSGWAREALEHFTSSLSAVGRDPGHTSDGAGPRGAL